jgi:hypothetical protein
VVEPLAYNVNTWSVFHISIMTMSLGSRVQQDRFKVVFSRFVIPAQNMKSGDSDQTRGQFYIYHYTATKIGFK